MTAGELIAMIEETIERIPAARDRTVVMTMWDGPDVQWLEGIATPEDPQDPPSLEVVVLLGLGRPL